MAENYSRTINVRGIFLDGNSYEFQWKAALEPTTEEGATDLLRVAEDMMRSVADTKGYVRFFAEGVLINYLPHQIVRLEVLSLLD